MRAGIFFPVLFINMSQALEIIPGTKANKQLCKFVDQDQVLQGGN